MSPITRAKKVKQEKEAENDQLSRINALSHRMDNLERLNEFTKQSDSLRRTVRSQYSVIKNLIDEKRDEIGAAVSNKFNIVLSGVDDLYRNVKRPREQVADAEALLGLTNTVVESLDLCPPGSISPTLFVSSLLRGYGLRIARSKIAIQNLIIGKSQKAVNWEKIGADASLLFMEGKGCKTMLGVLKTEFKPEFKPRKILVYDSYPNKIAVYRNRKSPMKVHLTQPKLVLVESAEDKPDVNKNMSTISEILKEEKRVVLDKLFFRRTSFAHTVENLFALSFLVCNGQAAISTDETGSRFLCEMVPQSNAHLEAVHHHFILRYDYKDWKLMQDLVPEGKELIPKKAVSCFKP